MANIKIPDLSSATNVQGSDLLVLEQAGGTAKVEVKDLFRGGAGINISGNQISTNNIVNIGLISDLNMVAYPSTLTNYIGYTNSSTTNKPDTAGSGMVILSATNNVNWGSMLYMTDVSLFKRTLSSGTWGAWIDIQNTTVATATPTVNTGYITNANNHLVLNKIGKVVQLTGYINVSYEVPTYTRVFTIPDGYKPKHSASIIPLNITDQEINTLLVHG